MLVTKVCKMCGVEFDSKHPNGRYCSARCRLDYEAAYIKLWRDKNREHYREYQRNYQRNYGKVKVRINETSTL